MVSAFSRSSRAAARRSSTSALAPSIFSTMAPASSSSSAFRTAGRSSLRSSRTCCWKAFLSSVTLLANSSLSFGVRSSSVRAFRVSLLSLSASDTRSFVSLRFRRTGKRCCSSSRICSSSSSLSSEKRRSRVLTALPEVSTSLPKSSFALAGLVWISCRMVGIQVSKGWREKSPLCRFPRKHNRGEVASLSSSGGLWHDLMSRTKGWDVLSGRDRVRQRGSAVDGLDDLIGRKVMDHVAETGKNRQLALGDLLVQPLGLTIHINDLVVPARQDHDRQLQFTIVLLQLHHG